MSEFDLEAIDGLSFSEEHRALLRPGDPVEAENGNVHHLPRFFFACAKLGKSARNTPRASL
jgi:hypothetical protein